jgi:hypothetical protein
MDDRVGPYLTQRGEQVLAVHHVGYHGLSAGLAQPLSIDLAAGYADDLVIGGDELPGERCTDGARGAGEQYSHGFIPYLFRTGWQAFVRQGCQRFVGLGTGSFLPRSLIVAGLLSAGWNCPGE